MGINDPQKDILGILFRPNRFSFAVKVHSSKKISSAMDVPWSVPWCAMLCHGTMDDLKLILNKVC